MMKYIIKVKNTIFYFWFLLVFFVGFGQEVNAQTDLSQPGLYDWSLFLFAYWTTMSLVLGCVYYSIRWGLTRAVSTKRKWSAQHADHFAIFFGFLVIFPVNFLVLSFYRQLFSYSEPTPYAMPMFLGADLMARYVLFVTTTTLLLLWLGNIVYWILYGVKSLTQK